MKKALISIISIVSLVPFSVSAQSTTTDFSGGTELGIAFILFLISFAMGLYVFRVNFFGKEK